MTRQANEASVNQLCELASTWSQIIRRKCRKAGSLVASGRKPLLVKLHLGRTELPRANERQRLHTANRNERERTIPQTGVVRSLHSSSPPARLALQRSKQVVYFVVAQKQLAGGLKASCKQEREL